MQIAFTVIPVHGYLYIPSRSLPYRSFRRQCLTEIRAFYFGTTLRALLSPSWDS